MVRLRRSWPVLGVVVVCSLVLVGAAPALAHAYVVSTAPANGASLSVAPKTVTARFDEPVMLPAQADAVAVLDTSGDRVDDGSRRLSTDRRTLTIGLEPDLPKGVYIASWSVISADTHPVGGSIQFGVGMPAVATAPAPVRTPDPLLTLVTGVTKGLVYAGLVVGLGLLPAALLLGAVGGERRRVVGAARVGLLVAVVASVAQVVVQYLWTTSSLPAGTTGDPGGFLTGAYAVAVWVRVAALLVALVAVPVVASRPREVVTLVAGLVAVGALVHNGHGGSGEWWRYVSTLAHATAAILWIGGLAALGWLLLQRRLSGDRLRVLPRWSAYAACTVVVLAVSGVVQGVVGVGFLGALTSTTYGVLLLGKVALVLVALGFAVVGNRAIRTWVGAPEPDGGPVAGATARLRSWVRLEAAVGVVVVLLSGVLSSVTPAEAAYAPVRTLHDAVGPFALSLKAGPARRGPVSFRVRVTPRSASGAQPESIRLALSQVDGPVKDLHVDVPYRLSGALHPGEPTPVTFASAAVTIPSAGEWTAIVTVVAGPLDQYVADFDIEVE